MTGAEIARYILGLLMLGVVVYRERMSWPHVIVLGLGSGLMAGAS